ncbi:hypothetical protein HC891_20375 [Candidatus Gracilibacteria bacterium]|nr:hypothetical protein [Candidatus Gracilibacteria bacterium]
MNSSPAFNTLIAAPPPLAWPRAIAIALGYLLLGIALTWPLALHLGDSVIQKGGYPVDTGQGIWNLWWARNALLGGYDPFITPYLFYPQQVDLFFQTLSLPNALLVAPVLLAFGPIAAFNAVTLLSFAIGGYATFRLAQAVLAAGATKNREPRTENQRIAYERQAFLLPALLAGFVFVAAPYHMQMVYGGPMELIAVHWLPLYLLALMRALRTRKPLAIALAALLLLLTTLASQYYGLYAALYTVFHASLAALLAPAKLRLHTLLSAAGIACLWLLALVPVLVGRPLGAAALDDWYERQVFHSPGLLNFVAPANVFHPLWGDVLSSWYAQQQPFGLEAGVPVSFALALLVMLALFFERARSWPWLLLALILALFALGPALRWADATSGLPGPFLLLDTIGIFRNSSRPSVFLALLGLPLAVLAALGLNALLSHTARVTPHEPSSSVLSSRFSVLGSFSLACLLALEWIVAPWELTRLAVDPVVASLNRDPAPGAVLALPPRNNDSQYLLDQLCHGRPLLGGYLARLPDYPLNRGSSALQRLWNAEMSAPDILSINASDELAALGVSYVTLDRTRLPRAEQEALHAWLHGTGVERMHASETLLVYAVEPRAAAVVTLGAGWYAAESDATRSWRWMGAMAEIRTIARQATPATLHLRATAFSQDRSLEIWHDKSRIGQWTIPAAPYDRLLRLDLLLPPGVQTLHLRSPTSADGAGRELSLSVSDLRLEPRANALQAHTLRIPPTLPAPQHAPCGV